MKGSVCMKFSDGIKLGVGCFVGYQVARVICITVNKTYQLRKKKAEEKLQNK